MNPFKLITSRIHMRSSGQILSRFASILFRYTLSAEPITSILVDFVRFAKKQGFRPSFPVTASVLFRHPALFRKLQQLGAEFSVHGYRHIDYTDLSRLKSLSHFKEADHLFREAGIHYSGFRFPFLRRDPDQIHLLAKSGFLWDSSDVIGWPFERPSYVTKTTWQNYLNILDSYHPGIGGEVLSLPRHDYGLIEIPVSVPDDDILIERLHLRQREINKIWEQILNQTHQLGECFVIQLHPERFPFYKSTLKTLVDKAQRTGSIWIASLGDIAEWWQRKSEFRCQIETNAKTGWKVSAEFIEDGVLLGQNIPALKTTDFFWKKWQVLSNSLTIKCPTKPIIGLPPDAHESLKIFLADEGYIFELTEKPDNYSVSFSDFPSTDKIEKKKILERIEKSENPVIRFWRWPRPFVSCFSVTGDIDGVDLWDYWSRFYGS